MKNRPERKISFLVVWLTMFSCILGYGQVFYKMELKADFLKLNYPGEPVVHLYPNQSIYQTQWCNAPTPGGIILPGPTGYIEQKPYKGINWSTGSGYTQPADFYYMQSGFFCKREWEFEKATHIPLRFRLGSLADCNAMEGKH